MDRAADYESAGRGFESSWAHLICMERDRIFLLKAFEEAEKALEKGEVPIGAVVVLEGEVIGRGHNLKETTNDPTAHAEIIALREASRNLGSWRLNGTTLYTTLEPCPMCLGAMLQARVSRLVFSSYDPRWGACGSLYDLSRDERLNHQIEVVAGIHRERSGYLLKTFFENLRKEKAWC